MCVHVTNSFAVYTQQTYFKITAINTCSHCFIFILVFFIAARRTPAHSIVSMWSVDACEQIRVCLCALLMIPTAQNTSSYTLHKRVLNNLSQMKDILFATCCLLRKCFESMIKVFHEP